MKNVHDISDRYKKRTMQVDKCAGCSKEFREGDYYTEIGVPGARDDEVTHIALCDGCYKEAKKEGVF